MSPFAKLSGLIRNKPRADVSSTRLVQMDDTQRLTHPDERDPLPLIPPPIPGDRLGDYILQGPLGSGASCHVFRAWHEINHCPVAIKIVNWANVVDRNAALRQMRMEAATLARINHPRVLRFIDFGFDARWPYLVTEFVDGQPLGELLRAGGGLPIDWALHLMSQVVDGLGAVWKAGIVHRDLKPDNILVSTSGVAKIIDFGVAKSEILKNLEGENSPELAGTAAYLSPEQARDAAVADRRSDIYSLGVTFFETMTGRLPFEASNRMQMIFQHLKTSPPPATKFNSEIPQLASDLCLWMLSKNPDVRPQHYEDLREGLNTVLASI
jgi:serine/threonine-protein kinase